MNSSRSIIAILLIILCGFLSSCPLGDRGCPNPRDCDGFADYVDPVVTTIGGAIDDQVGSLFAAIPHNRHTTILRDLGNDLIVKKAWAAACTRPATAACINEAQSTEYVACIIDSFTVTGSVNMAYTGTPNCGFIAVGDTVTRTLNVSRTTGDNYLIKTVNKNIDSPNSPGGGIKLTITGTNQYNLEIIGIHKLVNNSANALKSFEMDLRTTTPITITGGLARAMRVVDGGTVEFSRAHGSVTLSPANLTYSPDCCYPIAGSMRLTDTADTGFVRTATITFPQCGTASLQWDPINKDIGGGDPSIISLISCE